MTELKPCPFCGREAEVWVSDVTDRAIVYCTVCDAQIRIRPNEQEAIEAWNRRAEKKAVRYRADLVNGKYVCSECGHNVIWNPECEDKLMELHPYCNTCGAKIIGIEDYHEVKESE